MRSFQSVTSFGLILLSLHDVSVTPAGVPDAGSTLSLLSLALLGVAVAAAQIALCRCERQARSYINFGHKSAQIVHYSLYIVGLKLV